MTTRQISTHENPTLMARALALCQRMAAASVEMRLVTRLPVLVEEFGQPHRALMRPDEVRALLEIDDELIEHARPSLHRAILAAVDETARTFVPNLDRHGWRTVLLAALEVDEPSATNVVLLSAWRSGGIDAA